MGFWTFIAYRDSFKVKYDTTLQSAHCSSKDLLIAEPDWPFPPFASDDFTEMGWQFASMATGKSCINWMCVTVFLTKSIFFCGFSRSRFPKWLSCFLQFLPVIPLKEKIPCELSLSYKPASHSASQGVYTAEVIYKTLFFKILWLVFETEVDHINLASIARFWFHCFHSFSCHFRETWLVPLPAQQWEQDDRNSHR